MLVRRCKYSLLLNTLRDIRKRCFISCKLARAGKARYFLLSQLRKIGKIGTLRPRGALVRSSFVTFSTGFSLFLARLCVCCCCCVCFVVVFVCFLVTKSIISCKIVCKRRHFETPRGTVSWGCFVF